MISPLFFRTGRMRRHIYLLVQTRAVSNRFSRQNSTFLSKLQGLRRNGFDLAGRSEADDIMPELLGRTSRSRTIRFGPESFKPTINQCSVKKIC